MRDWQVEQDAFAEEQRRAHMATVGDVERIALEIAGDNDDRILRLVAALDGRLREVESERHSVARLWETVDRLRADFGAMAERLLRAEAALVDAHRRLDVVAKRRAGDERDTRLLVERVASLERRLADIEERQDGREDGGRS